MTVTPTTDTNNILNTADTSANKSKYMTKSLDCSGFGDVLDKVSKNYTDKDTTVNTKQSKNETSQKTDNATVSSNEKAEYKTENSDKATKNKTDKTDRKSKSDKSDTQVSKNDDVKENYEKVAGDKSQEQKIQDETKLQNKEVQEKCVQDNQNAKEEIQEVIVQNVENGAVEELESSLLSQQLQEIRELPSATENLVQNVDIKIDNTEIVASKELSQLVEENLDTSVNNLLNKTANLSESLTSTATNLETTSATEDLLQQNITNNLQVQKPLTANENQGNILQTANNAELSVVKNNVKVLSEDKNANMLQTEEMIETPIVKVQNDEAVMQNVKELSAEDKVNAKNILDNKNLNQSKLDELDVKIKSVVSYGENNNNTSAENSQNGETNQGFQMQQSVEEQAVRLELEVNSEVKTSAFSMSSTPVQPTESVSEIVNTDIVDASNILDNISPMQNLGSVKNVDTPQNIQTQNVQIPKNISSADIMSQIDKQLDAKAIQSAGTTKVSIILKPENLGRLQLELVSSKDGLEAKMIASSPQVKEILDKNLETLRETLGSQGINVSNVTVKVAETQKSDMAFDFDQHSRNNQGFQKDQSQKTKENGFQNQDFEQDLENEQGTEEEIIYTASEQTTTISGLNGRVAYKL